jgi:hypothetical protein
MSTSSQSAQSAQILKNQRETANMINALIEQSKDSLLCGPDCQQQKTSNELEQKYLAAQTDLKTAPIDFQNAKKNYYVFTEGQSAYNNMLEGELKDKANKIGELIKEKFNEEIEQAKTLNIYLNTDIINSKNTLELYKSYLIKNEKSEKKIKYSHGDILTNDRKSFYENQESESLKGWYTIFFVSYYILALVYFGKCILSMHLLPLKFKISILGFLITFPYIVDPITQFLIHYAQKVIQLIPKDVYQDTSD